MLLRSFWNYRRRLNEVTPILFRKSALTSLIQNKNSGLFPASGTRHTAVQIANGTRSTKANPVEGEHQLFGFLTTEPNDIVGAIHPKAMPVILTTLAEIEKWMTASVDDALTSASTSRQ